MPHLYIIEDPKRTRRRAKLFSAATCAICLTVMSCAPLKAVVVPGPIRTSPPATVQRSNIPPSFFGMSVLNFQSVQPLLTFGTARSWDAYSSNWSWNPGLAWPDISPSRGVYFFPALENFIEINQARNADIIYTFGRTPDWASASPDAPGIYGPGQCAPPANLADWDAFLTAIATQANGRIKYWEIWNEPTFAQSYCGDVGTMVTLAEHASRIIKGIYPSALILSPSGTGTNGPSWLDGFLSAGGGAFVDLIAFHGYGSATAEDINELVSGYRAVMAKHNISSMPLWDTEASWAGSSGGVGGITDIPDRMAFLAKYYLLQWSLGVSRFVWYAYDGQAIWGQLWDSTTGLHGDGVAYEQVYKWMVGASMLLPCSEDASGTWGCILTRSGYKEEVVWNSTSTKSIPAAGFVQFSDLYGNTTPITTPTINIGTQPILLQTRATK